MDNLNLQITGIDKEEESHFDGVDLIFNRIIEETPP